MNIFGSGNRIDHTGSAQSEAGGFANSGSTGDIKIIYGPSHEQDHRTTVQFLGERTGLQRRGWIAVPVAAAALVAWFTATAAVAGQLLPALMAAVVGAVTWSGLTVWQTARTRQERQTAARKARDAFLRPLELPPLVESAHSVATLIAPERALTRLEARGKQKQQLLDWCTNLDAAAVHILDGPGGVGKSRLTVEIGRQLASGWAKGRCVTGRAGDVLAPVVACGQPTLIVVDDADTQPDVPRLIEQVGAMSPQDQPVRVLLVVRSSAAFNQAINHQISGSVAGTWPVLTLEPSGSGADQSRWFDHALAAYAAATGQTLPPGMLAGKRRVGESGEPMAITQVRAALTILHANSGDATRFRVAPLTDLAATLVVHERRRWREAATDPRWKLPKTLSDNACDEAMLALVAFAPTSPEEATNALRGLPRFSDQSEDGLLRIATWANQLYPGPSSGGVWVDPGGDFLVGCLIDHVLSSSAAPAAYLLRLTKVAEQRPVVLLRLIRAAPQFPSISSVVTDALTRSPRIASHAIEHMVVGGIKSHSLQQFLATIIAAHPLPSDDAARLLELLPEYGWNETRGALHHSLVHSSRYTYLTTGTAASRSDLADDLIRLATSLQHLGKHREALIAEREAVGIYRRLSEDGSGQSIPDLANSLNNLGGTLRELGQHHDALAAQQEAVDLYRRLPQPARGRHTGDLANALGTLGNGLRDLGEYRRALIVDQEAITLYRRLTQTGLNGHTEYLANALNNLGLSLASLGEDRDALAAHKEAVTLYRTLADNKPDSYTHYLANTLNSVGNGLRKLGEDAAALRAHQEAVDLYRRLADTEPGRYTHYLANALGGLGNSLIRLNETVDALRAHQQSITLYRRLAHTEPSVYNEFVAQALTNLGASLHNLGDERRALAATQEAVTLYRQLAETEPGPHTFHLAHALTNLGSGLGTLGDERGALAATAEAVTLYRQLAEIEPSRPTPYLARALTSLGSDLGRVGEDRSALAAYQEAVTLYRQLTETEPTLHTAALANALVALSDHLLRQEDRVEALARRGESAARWQHLADLSPGSFDREVARERSEVARFCSQHGFPLARAAQAENEARREFDL